MNIKNKILASAPLTLEKHRHFPLFKSENVFENSGHKIINFFNHTGGEKFPFPIPMHSHEFFEINIVMSGKGVHYINNGRVLTKTGDVFIIEPQSEHGYFELSNLKICHILIGKTFFEKFKADLETMDGYLSLFNIEPKFRGTLDKNAFLSLNKEQFESVLEDIKKLELYSKVDVYNQNIQSALVFMIICKFCKFYHQKNLNKTANRKNLSYTSIVILAIEYMKKNLGQSINIDLIAKNVYLSRSTFIRYFKSVTGFSPLTYLTLLRVKRAKQLLKNTDLTITYIANDCGFFDSSHFEKVFLKHLGVTPSAYRKNFSGQKIKGN